ncbi:MAG: ADP-ribosylglycohydrolase family protein [Phycisphaerales bacterium]|nr:ADP-ribosylglycohydrolase family protein [Planctomycetota bacterium]MCH8507624.1 ADP-ribosylglycohydrolase family protein [Phycisphaerales bacterium]
MQRHEHENKVRAFLLGTMVGDAVGLPFEGMSRSRVAAVLGNKPLGHRLVFGRGMVSDDSEHAMLTVAAWRASRGDPAAFSGRLASELRWWFAALPAGTGMGTAKACARLLLGFGPSRSGIKTAGNGPLMRSGVLGLLCATDAQLVEAVRISTRITHTDPRAECAALALALMVRIAASGAPADHFADACVVAFEESIPEGEPLGCFRAAIESVRRGEDTAAFADKNGCSAGVTGFALHTLPAVLHLWLSHPADLEAGVEHAVRLGGDTDTVAALAGGLIAVGCPARRVPRPWRRGIWDPPAWRRYKSILEHRAVPGMVRWPSQFVRNIWFLLVVLIHGFRRLLPPYGGR